MVATFATMLLSMGKTLAGTGEQSSKGDLQVTSHFRFSYFSDFLRCATGVRNYH
jgi:hypothetical protein